ncbi:MAG: hypothetical protein ACRDP9_12795 [Kribbellaceae bacterium]
MLTSFARSAVMTAVLLARHQLRLPRNNVGRQLQFADGTTPRVYRETVRAEMSTVNPSLLVVRFRLRVIGDRGWLHAAFRVESILNTPLFAGFPGFRTKLWAYDRRTSSYRGVYEWDGADLATAYADTLCRLLRVLSVPGSVDFHVEPGVPRDEFLRNPGAVRPSTADADRWWRLGSPVPM